MNKYLSDPNFSDLCDFVAQGNLICFTGSGVSKDLQLINGQNAPNWFELINRIMNKIESKKEDDIATWKNINLIRTMIDPKSPGECFIEAASILNKIDPDLFLSELEQSANLKENSYSKKHELLLKLNPVGILTYNYDLGHENAISSCNENWNVILPSDEERIIEILKNKFSQQFLFKMHGTVNKRESMVLTRESYRDLFVRYPYYKAFLQQIFTNYHLLIVGFGMSDPDFETMMQSIFSTFGSPIQKHILIKLESQKSAKDILYQLRYGIHCLYVSDFSDIEGILTDCTTTPGKYLKSIMEEGIGEDLSLRHSSHENARNLCDMGKKCLASQLKHEITNSIKPDHSNEYNDFETSEYIYLLGVVVNAMKANTRKEYKDFLMNIVNNGISVDTVAYALIHLRDILEEEDIGIVLQWAQKYKNISSLVQRNQQRQYEFNKVYSYCSMNAHFLIAKYDLSEADLKQRFSISDEQLFLLKT